MEERQQNSQNPYSISPDLLRELDKMLYRMGNRINNADVPPAGSDFFRYKGAATIVELIKNLCFGVDREKVLYDTEHSILRHDDMRDEPSNELAEEED